MVIKWINQIFNFFLSKTWKINTRQKNIKNYVKNFSKNSDFKEQIVYNLSIKS